MEESPSFKTLRQVNSRNPQWPKPLLYKNSMRQRVVLIIAINRTIAARIIVWQTVLTSLFPIP